MLDVSGFEEDAADVTRKDIDNELVSRFALHTGVGERSISGIDAAELRHALAELAAGSSIEQIKFNISARLYKLIAEKLAKLTPSAITNEIRPVDDGEYETFSAIGGSLVNMPRRRPRPVSSLELG